MEKTGNSSKKHSLWALASVLAPVTHAASSESWAGVLVVSAAALFLGKWSAYGTGWVLKIQRLWSAIVIALTMNWSAAYWPDLPFTPAVPYILLVLAVWTVIVPGKAARIGCVLLAPILILLGGVLLSGVSEIQLQYLKPSWTMPNVILLPFLLLPYLEQGKKSGSWKAPAFALLVSIIVAGVLSPKVSRGASSGIYELSRSLSFLGIAERFESLVAAAMTLGFYGVMTYLLEPAPHSEKTWPYALLAAALYPIAEKLPGWFYAVGSIAVWAVLPGFTCKKIFSENGKKVLDKRE